MLFESRSFCGFVFHMYIISFCHCNAKLLRSFISNLYNSNSNNCLLYSCKQNWLSTRRHVFAGSTSRILRTGATPSRHRSGKYVKSYRHPMSVWKSVQCYVEQTCQYRTADAGSRLTGSLLTIRRRTLSFATACHS